ncbi:tyrosine-type recombinase/integrase [Ornithinibacillus sp. JPR2-1]|uniref:site-specific integrase n=1 Tax=Ornithinibacillus sp. JPR2-1 TaxID=2094019 RepID=UPI0031D32584
MTSKNNKKRKGYARPRGNGRWQLEVDVGKKLYGKGRNRKYKTVTAKNETEANIELAKFIAELFDKGYMDLEDIGFVEFVENVWKPKCAQKRLSETTYENYMGYLNSRIIPAFQYFQLDEIKPIHIIDFLANLEEEGMRLTKYKDKKKEEENKNKPLATSTILYYHRILNNIFNFAVEIKALEESPLKGVKKPTVEYKEIEPYTIDEAITVYQALDKELLHWNIAFKLAIVSGMRRSEIYGLDLLKHIDLDRRILHVREALTYTKEHGYVIGEIKKGSRRAKRRDISIPEDLIGPIKELIEQRLEERSRFKKEELWREGKHFLLLSHENGEPFNPDSMKNWWERFLKRHKLRYVNIHALRHTMVTLLIELGIPLSQISKRAGHSGISITNDTYGHRVQTIDELATTRLSELLNRNVKEKEDLPTNRRQLDGKKIGS